MTFFAILISLLLERMFLPLHTYRRFDWFADMAGWIRRQTGKFCGGPCAVLLVMLPVPLLVILLTSLLDGLLFNLFTLLFGIAVLFLCLGPRDMDTQVTAMTDALYADDMEEMRKVAVEVVDGELAEDNRSLARQLVEAMLLAGNERVIAILFWFVVLGPVGAVLFRLSSELRLASRGDEDAEYSKYADRLHAILAWLPSRLCALGYAVTGSFVDALHNWQQNTVVSGENWMDTVDAVVLSAGLGALQFSEDDDSEYTQEDLQQQLKAGMALVWRMVVMWVSVIALMTLSGWGLG
jgi:membrane protein required for beta-lactamase induction